MAGQKVNYGVCINCKKKPVVYQGSRFCSPRCEFDYIAKKQAEEEELREQAQEDMLDHDIERMMALA